MQPDDLNKLVRVDSAKIVAQLSRRLINDLTAVTSIHHSSSIMAAVNPRSGKMNGLNRVFYSAQISLT